MQSQLASAAAMGRFVLWALGIAVAASTAGATEPPTLQSIREQIREQWSQVRNLHVRLRQQTIVCGEPRVLVQGSPVLVQTTTLACCVINQVPSDLFDFALTKRPPPPDFLFSLISAYHWLERNRSHGTVTEVWAAKGRGRRMEVRRDSQLLVLSIDTTQWSLIWRPALNRATLLPSRLPDHLREDAFAIPSRESSLRSGETLTALFRVQAGRLGNKKVDKVTAYFPADPMVAGEWPIHEFDPRLQSKVSGMEYRTRENWFDPSNNLNVHRRCGCQDPKWERTVAFPPLESIGPSYFSFKLPQGAQLSATNKALRRLFLATSEDARPESASRRKAAL